MEKLEIDYPTHWPYKVIGADRQVILETAAVVLEQHVYQVVEANQSRTGKFISFNFSVHVHSDEERNNVFAMLRDIPSVKVVI